MTTTVTVNAHCDPKTTKVRVSIGERETPEEDKFEYLLDGESKDFVVYDDKYISVDEIPKD